jgi:hypothetical protein
MSGASRILSGVCGIYRDDAFADDGTLEWLYTTFKGFINPCNSIYVKQYMAIWCESKDVPSLKNSLWKTGK